MAKIEVKSEITGTVWQINVSPGDRVEAGDTLIVIESMKMEIGHLHKPPISEMYPWPLPQTSP